MYYLQSRYYDPEVGRFLNADAFPSTGQGLTGNNMFAYCGNNPISRADTQGTLWHVAFGASFGSKFMDYHRKQFAKNIGLDGIETALTKLVKHTAKWAQSNLAVDTTLGVLKATFGNKATGVAIKGSELLAQA